MVLEKLYSAAIGGHLGASKIFEARQARVWWLKMQVDIEAYVAVCLICQIVKFYTTIKPVLL